MNHSFVPSQIDTSKCGICHFNVISHTSMASCECCKNIGTVTVEYGNMLMCAECKAKELATHLANNTPEKQQARVDDMNSHMDYALSLAKSVDSSIEVKTDIFNAETLSIVELQGLIAENSEITNKPFELASRLTERFNKFKTVIFELNQQIVEAGNKQKAIQTYLNQLANQLRVEEREKLKIADINYKPNPAAIKKPKAIKTAKPKLDKAELRKFASELGIAEFTLQSLVVMRGCTVSEAADMLRKSINEGKSMAVADNKPAVDMDELD